jgi:hypothetical protein
MQFGWHESSLGMSAQKFHKGYGNFDTLNFGVSCGFHYSSCMKRLRVHPRQIRASQLESFKRDLTATKPVWTGTDTVRQQTSEFDTSHKFIEYLCDYQFLKYVYTA